MRSTCEDSVSPALRLGLRRCPACAGSWHLSPAWRLPGPLGFEGLPLTGRLFRSGALLGRRRVPATAPSGVVAGSSCKSKYHDAKGI